MQKKKMLAFVGAMTLALATGISFAVSSNNNVSKAEADSIVLDDTTDYASASNYGYRTKNTETGPEKAYGNMDLANEYSIVYTDLQYSSYKSLRLVDKGTTNANSPLCLLNCFGTADEVKAGITFGSIKNKLIEFMIYFGGEAPESLSFSITDLETNATRLTSTVSAAPGRAYLSSADGSVWHHMYVDLSKFGYNTGKSDENKVGALRIQTPTATDYDYCIDQLRLVDELTFDDSKATRKPFDDHISMYEDDDNARANIFYGGKYSYVESTSASDIYGQSTRSLVITATGNNSAYSNFFIDLWDDGIRLDKFGDDAKLVAYITGSLTNVEFTSHAARFAFTFSTNDHQKATGNATATAYFESFEEADNTWYYMEFPLKSLLDSAVSAGYPLDETTVYGLRCSNGNYQIVTGDYYKIDALMVIGMKDAYDLVSDVTAVDTCNSDAETTQGFVNRYNALNGYDKNFFATTEVDDYTLGYKLDYMAKRYEINFTLSSSSMLFSQFDSTSTNNPIILVICGLCVCAGAGLLLLKRKKNK